MGYGFSTYEESYRYSDRCEDWAEDSKLKWDTIAIKKPTVNAALEKPIYIWDENYNRIENPTNAQVREKWIERVCSLGENEIRLLLDLLPRLAKDYLYSWDGKGGEHNVYLMEAKQQKTTYPRSIKWRPRGITSTRAGNAFLFRMDRIAEAIEIVTEAQTRLGDYEDNVKYEEHLSSITSTTKYYQNLPKYQHDKSVTDIRNLITKSLMNNFKQGRDNPFNGFNWADYVTVLNYEGVEWYYSIMTEKEWKDSDYLSVGRGIHLDELHPKITQEMKDEYRKSVTDLSC